MRIAFGGGLTVTATERWYDEIRAGRAFMLGTLLGASVGNFSEVQLLNPAGSGITLIAFGLWTSHDTANDPWLRTHDVALGTLVGAGVNLQAGEAAGAGVLRTAQPAAIEGTPVAQTRVAANSPFAWFENWGFELGDGEGILFSPGAVNLGIRTFAQWIEV